jgi:predicted Zn-dependent peptidase
MKSRFVPACLLVIFPVIAFAQTRPGVRQPTVSAPPAYMQHLKSYDQEGAVTKVVLKNGLTVIVAEQHATPLVEIFSWIRTGYADDPPEIPGASRLISRLIFRGSTNRSAASTAAELKALGGEIHASSDYDHTSFWAIAPANQYKKVLEIQADALLNPRFDSAEISRQAREIFYEIADGKEDPENARTERLLQTGIAGDRIRRGRSLSGEFLKGIDRNKLEAFYRAAYGPERSLLVICGDVIPPDVLNAVAGSFAGAKSGTWAENRGAVPATPAGLRYTQLQVAEPYATLTIAFRTAAENSPDFVALEVLRAVLGAGEAGILNRRLKNEKKMIASGSSSLWGFGDSSCLSLRMSVDPGDLDRSLVAVFAELEILKGQTDREGELARARAFLTREFWEDGGRINRRAERYARFEALGSWKSVNTYLSRLGQVKWTDVTRVAARYLDIGNCVIMESLPIGGPTRNMNAEGIQSILKPSLNSLVEEEVALREKATVFALDIPSVAFAFAPNSIRYPTQKTGILRGPELVIHEDHTMPVIHLGIYYSGGRMVETGDNAGITNLMVHAMLRGAEDDSVDNLYRQLELYGGKLTPVVENDYFGVELSILSPYVEKGLDILDPMIRSPQMDPQAISIQKTLQKAARRIRSPQEKALELFSAALFGSYPYALDPLGTEESLGKISPEAVLAWHKLHVSDKKPIVVILGDTRGTSLASYFVQHFSGSRFEDTKPLEGYPPSPEHPVKVESDSGQNYSLLMVGFQAFPFLDEDFYPLIVYRNYISGPGGKFFDSILEKAPTARNLSVQYLPKLRGGSLWVSVRISPNEEDAGQKAIEEELPKTLASMIPYRDYRSSVNSAVTELQIQQQDRSVEMHNIVLSCLSGMGIQGSGELEKRLQEVKQGSIQDAAERILKMDKSVVLRMHGK